MRNLDDELRNVAPQAGHRGLRVAPQFPAPRQQVRSSQAPQQPAAPDRLASVPATGASEGGLVDRARGFVQGIADNVPRNLEQVGARLRQNSELRKLGGRMAFDLATAPGATALETAAEGVMDVGRGYRGTGDGTSQQPEEAAVKPSVDDLLINVPRRTTTDLGALPNREPRNDDPLASDFLSRNAREREPGALDVNNMQAVDGLNNVNYAGRYGDTEVFGNITQNEDGSRHGRFSDRDNLATLAGGQAAAVPEGRTAVGNADVAAMGGRTNIDEQLREGRLAAVNRGDFEAYDRSMMSSQERAAMDEQRRNERLRRQAYEQDPTGSYAVDQRAQSQAVQASLEADNQRFQRQRQVSQDARADRRDSREARTASARRVNDTFDILKSVLQNELGQVDTASLQAAMPVIQQIAEQYPEMDPISLAAEVQFRLENPEPSQGASNPEAAALIQSFL